MLSSKSSLPLKKTKSKLATCPNTGWFSNIEMSRSCHPFDLKLIEKLTKRMFLDQMKASFPEHEIPSFLTVEIDENSEKYKHDIRIYRKISKEIKNFKSEEKLNKEVKMRVNEELKTIQIALRSKMGFTAGSEKRPLTPYLMYSRDLREQAKKTTRLGNITSSKMFKMLY